jgi:hypothetical protein
LWATVTGDNCGKTEAGNPGRESGSSTIGGSGGGKWDNFRPAGCTICYGAEVVEAVGGRNWAYYVNINVGAFLLWDRNELWDSVGVVMNFAALTDGTLAGPEAMANIITRECK